MCQRSDSKWLKSKSLKWELKLTSLTHEKICPLMLTQTQNSTKKGPRAVVELLELLEELELEVRLVLLMGQRRDP